MEEEIKKLLTKIDTLIGFNGSKEELKSTFKKIKKLLDKFKINSEEKANIYYYQYHAKKKSYFQAINETEKAKTEEEFLNFYKNKIESISNQNVFFAKKANIPKSETEHFMLWISDKVNVDKIFENISIKFNEFKECYSHLNIEIAEKLKDQYLSPLEEIFKYLVKFKNIQNIIQFEELKEVIKSVDISISEQQQFFLSPDIIKFTTKTSLAALQENFEASSFQMMALLNILRDTLHVQLAQNLLDDILNKNVNVFADISLTEECILKRYRILALHFYPDKCPPNLSNIEQENIENRETFNKLFKLIVEQKKYLLEKISRKPQKEKKNFHVETGNFYWGLAKDIDFAIKKDWVKLKHTSVSELKNCTSEELLDLKNIYARNAYEQYRAAAKCILSDEDMREQVNLRKYMALALYLGGNLIEAQIQVMGAIYILTMRCNEVYSQDLKEIEDLYNKIGKNRDYTNQVKNNSSSDKYSDNINKSNEAFSLVPYLENKNLSPFDAKKIQAAVRPELNALIQRRFALAADDSIVKYKVSLEDILRVREKAVPYKMAVSVVAHSATITTLIASATLLQYLAERLVLSGGVVLGPIGGAGFILGGYLIGIGGLLLADYLKDETGKLLDEPKKRENLNIIISNAVEACKNSDYTAFFKALSENYSEKRFSSEKPLLEFEEGKFININPKEVITALLGHEFRPDGIAYLLNLIGEALLKSTHIFSDNPRSNLDNLACEIFKEIDKNENLEQKAKQLDENVRSVKQTRISLVSRLMKSYYSIPQEYLTDAQVAPFYSRFEEMRNIVRINCALTQIMIGGIDNLKLSHVFLNKVRDSIRKEYQFFTISSLRLEALDDLLFCFLGIDNYEHNNLLLPNVNPTEISKDEINSLNLHYLHNLLKNSTNVLDRAHIHKQVARVHQDKAEKIERAYHHLHALPYWQLAIQHYEYATMILGIDQETFFKYNHCLLAMTKFTKVKQLLEKNDLAKNFAEYWYLLATAERHLGNYDKASYAINSALRINPYDKAIINEASIIHNLVKIPSTKFTKRYEDINITMFNESLNSTSEKDSYNIMSIDGGGMRGAMATVFMSELERITKYHCASLFHSMAGTSTGSIIAAALSTPSSSNSSVPRYKASDILALYATQASRIFTKKKKGLFEFSLGGLNKPRYTNEGRYNLFKEYLGEKTCISEALSELVIPAAHVNGHGSYLFTRYNAQVDPEKNCFLWEAVMASTAAPTYFPPYSLSVHPTDSSITIDLVDGGVIANNPVMEAYTHAIKNLNIDHEKIFIWSIGTGDYVPDPIHPGKDRNLLFWVQNNEKVQKLIFDGPQNNLDNNMSAMLGNRYHRWQVWLEKPITLDDYSQPAIDKLINTARAYFEEMEADDSEKRLGNLIERLTGHAEKLTSSRAGFFSSTSTQAEKKSQNTKFKHETSKNETVQQTVLTINDTNNIKNFSSSLFSSVESSQDIQHGSLHDKENTALLFGRVGDDKIIFERHDTKGDGRCGLYTLPILNANALYDLLIEVLNNPNNQYYNECLTIIGEDILHLATSNSLNSKNTILTKILNLGENYLISLTEANYEELLEKCRTAKVCLAYIEADLKQRHWISIGIMKAWALITKTNLRIWQIQNKGSQTVNIRASHLPNDGDAHEILYVNGNHFELLSRHVDIDNLNSEEPSADSLSAAKFKM